MAYVEETYIKIEPQAQDRETIETEIQIMTETAKTPAMGMARGGPLLAPPWLGMT